MSGIERHQTSSGHPPGYQGGHPFTSTTKPPSTSVNSEIGAPNDGAHTGTTPPTRRRKQRMQPRDVYELANWLSERDFAIMHSVDEHQFLTARQVEALHFADHRPASGSRIARRTLARLRDFRLLGTLKRRVGGVRAGSASLVHYVDVVGRQLLEGRRGRHLRGFREPSARFLSHRLAAADTHISLVQADREEVIELVECAVEPASWRSYTGLGGARLTVKADLYAETAPLRGSEFVDAWFIEVDLGTETIPTLLKKCREYEAYRRTGVEQERRGGFPVVIWTVTHPDKTKAEQRRSALRAAIDSDSSLPNELFRIVAPDQLVPLLRAGGAS